MSISRGLLAAERERRVAHVDEAETAQEVAVGCRPSRPSRRVAALDQAAQGRRDRRLVADDEHAGRQEATPGDQWATVGCGAELCGRRWM